MVVNENVISESCWFSLSYKAIMLQSLSVGGPHLRLSYTSNFFSIQHPYIRPGRPKVHADEVTAAHIDLLFSIYSHASLVFPSERRQQQQHYSKIRLQGRKIRVSSQTWLSGFSEKTIFIPWKWANKHVTAKIWLRKQYWLWMYKYAVFPIFSSI